MSATPTYEDDALAAQLAAALGEDVTHDGRTYRKVRWINNSRFRPRCAMSECPLLGPDALGRDACDRYRYDSGRRRFPCEGVAGAPPGTTTIALVDRIPTLAMKGLLA